MKVRSTVKRAEEQIRAVMIQGDLITTERRSIVSSAIESRLGYAVEQALKWTHTHGKSESPLEIARTQARLLTTEISAIIRNTSAAA